MRVGDGLDDGAIFQLDVGGARSRRPTSRELASLDFASERESDFPMDIDAFGGPGLVLEQLLQLFNEVLAWQRLFDEQIGAGLNGRVRTLADVCTLVNTIGTSANSCCAFKCFVACTASMPL